MDYDAKVKVVVCEIRQWTNDWPSENLIEWRDWLIKKLNQIPKEYQNSAEINIEAVKEYSDASINLEIFYIRDLSDKERIKYDELEKEKEQSIKNRELQELKRLTDKYVGP